MYRLGGCPRCHGTLMRDQRDSVWTCLACGREQAEGFVTLFEVSQQTGLDNATIQKILLKLGEPLRQHGIPQDLLPVFTRVAAQRKSA